MCRVHNRFGDFLVEARQADVEAGLNRVGAVHIAQVDFRIDRRPRRESDLLFAGREEHRRREAGRPTRGEQLLGIGAGSVSAGHRKLDVEMTIGTAGGPAIASAGGVDLRGINSLLEFWHLTIVCGRKPGHGEYSLISDWWLRMAREVSPARDRRLFGAPRKRPGAVPTPRSALPCRAC